MVEKTISLAEMHRDREEGARFDFDPETMTIERFGELIDAMRQMAANESERIRADIERNQTNLEIIATLQALVRRSNASKGLTKIDFDLGPLEQILEELKEKSHIHPVVAYDFDFMRDANGGKLVKIRATPVELTHR